MVGEEGFEPPTLWSQTRCATKLRYSPKFSICLFDVSWVTNLSILFRLNQNRKRIVTLIWGG